MNSFLHIKHKLEQFIRRYYKNELIKGGILFLAIGLLYFLITLFIEYALWLNSTGRAILFWLFVAVETSLLYVFIFVPVARLLKLKKGLEYEEAARIIGTHFREIDDKLLNVLQLNKDDRKSELLLASIEQKSQNLKPIPFKLAIDFTKNLKYLKYAAIPLSIILFSFLLGEYSWFSDSYQRVVNYQIAYEPPAPFQFFIQDEELETIENKDFVIDVFSEGESIPGDALIEFGNESYFMKKINPGHFQFVFEQPKDDIVFNFSANGVVSTTYVLKVVKAPTLLGFEMFLDYPQHTYKKKEVLKSTGNTTVPRGTKVNWRLLTKETTEVSMSVKDTVIRFLREEDKFFLTEQILEAFDYTISTSNDAIKNHEELAFKIEVVRDQYPELSIQMQQDSTDLETLYFYGQASDDYGLRELRLSYFPQDEEEQEETINIPIDSGVFSEFTSTFPDNLNLNDGGTYHLYFRLFDNDAPNGFKETKSPVYVFRKLTSEEREQNQLREQSETIKNIDESIDDFEEQERKLEELSKTQKEKSELNFNDQKKLDDFLKRQIKQEEMMQNFNKKLQDNLEDFQNENEKDEFKESLKERLQENQEQLQRDEELLKELQRIADKINKEELTQKLEELAKQNKNKKRSMQQLLELTKRFYVAKKTEKLKQELEQLAKEQEQLSKDNGEENKKENQDKLNERFEEFQNELEELREENSKLKEPMRVPDDKQKEDEIKQDQKKASESLEQMEQSPDQQQDHQKDAQKNQRKAAAKMKQLSEQMNQMMAGGAQEQMSEDIETLRQILDNLVLFSFDQEALMNTFKSIQINHNEYAKNLIKQQGLREHFEHIDDSLFALSLRQPKISERINNEITEVYFNVDKSLEQFSENRIYQGAAAQQYTVTAANTLASFLSDVLDNMEMQMNPSSGSGEGEEQLPDIIMSQQQLNEMMKENMDKTGGEKKEQQGEEKEGEDGKQKVGSGDGNEEINGELYEIYKRQQQIREALKNKIAKDGNSNGESDLLKKMEDVELELLNKGFTNKTLQKMMELEHQLLKLENATFQQGEDNERKSRTNKDEFNSPTANPNTEAKRYFNTTEILNRQALPLQQRYKKKVQDYFKKKNDKF